MLVVLVERLRMFWSMIKAEGSGSSSGCLISLHINVLIAGVGLQHYPGQDWHCLKSIPLLGLVVS